MKQVIPINATKDGIAPTITSHYYKAGGGDFIPSNEPSRHLAILEIEMNEPKVIQIANLVPEQDGGFSNPQRGRVYSPDGLSPCIDNMGGGNREPKILYAEDICPTPFNHKGLEPTILSPIRTEEQRQLRKQGIDTFGGRQMLPRKDGVSNTITTVQKDNLLQEPIKIRQATAQGYIECPPGGGFDASYPNSKLRRGRVQDNGDVVGAITASADSHCVYEGMAVIGSMQANAMRGSIDGVSPCLTEAMGMGGGQVPMVTERMSRKDDVAFKEMPNGNIHAFRAHDPRKSTAPEWQITNENNVHPTITSSHDPKVLLKYRIRKLTPTECLRLMEVDDSDIEKMKSAKLTQTLKNGKVKERPMPKTQLYKMSGNSIVVDVLYHIFHQMFIAEPPKPKVKQLSLFDI